VLQLQLNCVACTVLLEDKIVINAHVMKVLMPWFHLQLLYAIIWMGI